MMAVLLAGWLFMQAAPGGNPIVTPPDIHVTNSVVVQVPPMDDDAVQSAAVQADKAFIVNVAQPVPVEWTNALCSLPDLWRTTPPEMTYNQPTVRDLAGKVAAAAIALLALAILAQGLGHALGQELTLGRVVFAIVMSAGNLIWWQIGIGLNNALSAAIGAPDLCTSLIRPHIELKAPTAGEAVGAPVLVIVYAVVSLLLLISLLFRLGLLDVLIVAGSLAMMCWATEQTEHIAQWYARLSVGTLFGQVLLVIGLQVAGVLSGIGNGLAGTLMAMVVLLLCRSLLGVLSSQQAQHGGSRLGMAGFLILRKLVAKF